MAEVQELAQGQEEAVLEAEQETTETASLKGQSQREVAAVIPMQFTPPYSAVHA